MLNAFKVVRDPIHMEIPIYPLEVLFMDTSVVQRLRKLSQLVGAEWVYPGATHTRFSHSIGTMHVAGMYAKRLFENDSAKIRLIRLAALLHDVAHGPFSHQFDDTIYRKMGLKKGHDDYREKLILSTLPSEVVERFLDISDPKFRRSVVEDFEQTMGKFENPERDFENLVRKILEIFRGEEEGSIEFNIVQGPLGADRLDFVLRDSYHSGVRNYSTVALDRIVRNSYVKRINGKEILCYDIKVMDDVYSFLFGRFMMYKNVYFHKTSRAVDLMIQELLNLADEILNLQSMVEDPRKFLKLTDDYIFTMMKEMVEREGESDPRLRRVKELLRRIDRRDLWKMIAEYPLSTKGVDPGIFAESVGEKITSEIKSRLVELLESGKYDEDDEDILRDIVRNFNDYFRIDTPYRLTLFHPVEFDTTKVFLYDSKKDRIMSFSDFERKYPFLTTPTLLQIVRIYATRDIREILRKYSLIPEDNMNITTRW
ncbi:MAG TPA: HD domain-containing protein [Thermotogales bacterium]|nr:HD domain-containing protein [Thermotogales bacterium]